jgi:hypothetical protein
LLQLPPIDSSLSLDHLSADQLDSVRAIMIRKVGTGRLLNAEHVVAAAWLVQLYCFLLHGYSFSVFRFNIESRMRSGVMHYIYAATYTSFPLIVDIACSCEAGLNRDRPCAHSLTVRVLVQYKMAVQLGNHLLNVFKQKNIDGGQRLTSEGMSKLIKHVPSSRPASPELREALLQQAEQGIQPSLPVVLRSSASQQEKSTDNHDHGHDSLSLPLRRSSRSRVSRRKSSSSAAIENRDIDADETQRADMFDQRSVDESSQMTG